MDIKLNLPEYQPLKEYKRSFTHKEYFDFFHEEVVRHSDGMLDIAWTPHEGFHTRALKEIGFKEYCIWIPAKYVLTVCK